jgi:hypothetical protein
MNQAMAIDDQHEPRLEQSFKSLVTLNKVRIFNGHTGHFLTLAMMNQARPTKAK